MKQFLARYMDELPEKFNDDFILSRDDNEILEKVRDIFMDLEIIPQIHINREEIQLQTDESEFGPIKQQGRYYKPVAPSRLNRIHYKVTIDGIDHPIERDLYINKMLDKSFYINEGIRYYLIWQIVDASSYGFGTGISFSAMTMPITMVANNRIDYSAEFEDITFKNLPVFDFAVFKRVVSPLIYIMSRYALQSIRSKYEKIDDVNEFMSYQDPGIIDYFNDYFGVNLKFSDNPDELVEDGRVIFAVKNNKETGVYYSIPREDLNTDAGRTILSLFAFCRYPRKKENKKNIVFKYDDLTNMWFWLDTLVSAFVQTQDIFRKYEKVKAIFISLGRMIDEPTRKILRLEDKWKQDVFTIMKYAMYNFDELASANGQDLGSKRVRLYEYLLFPLRAYFGTKINAIFNEPTTNIQNIEKIFTGLMPMFLIKECITSELLHYFNSTNEFNLYGVLLRYTFHGPQGYGSSVSIDQRSLHPSYTGRLSLIGSNAGDPGTSGTFVPFLKLYENGYFTPLRKED